MYLQIIFSTKDIFSLEKLWFPLIISVIVNQNILKSPESYQQLLSFPKVHLSKMESISNIKICTNNEMSNVFISFY